MVDNVMKIPLIHYCSLVQNHNFICYLRNSIKVVRNKDHRGLMLLFNDCNSFKISNCVNSIDCSGRLICNQQRRPHGHGNSNHNTLQHSAGKLVWIFFQCLLWISDLHFI